MNEILLFTFNLNKQKINIKLQKIKTAMLKTYAMIENSHMLLIVNQINQLFDENTKIVKINMNIELLAMQAKLNMIIKNHFKSVIKFKTTKTTQNFKKSLTINFIKSFQIKSSVVCHFSRKNPQSEKHQFQTVLVRKNPQKNRSR